MIRVIALAVLLGLPALAVAETPPPLYSLRQLSVLADTVVLGDPVDPVSPTRFKVREVLRGKAARVGTTITFADLSPHEVRSFDPASLALEGPRPRRIGQALLFLAPTKAGPRLVPSGLRFWVVDGRVLVPRAPSVSGNYTLVVEDSADWCTLLSRARADAATLNRLDELKRLARPQARSRALLDWAERHQSDFGAVWHDRGQEGTGSGWGKLETAVFAWALEGVGAEDCWSAVKLYAELNHGATPPLPAGCALATPAGRAFLLDQAARDNTLRGDRLRALALLVRAEALRAITATEHQGLVERLSSLLASKDGPFRAGVARAILAACPAKNGARERGNKVALPALVRAYKEEAPGPVRDELAEVVCVIGGPEHWQTVSGNPPGVLACTRDLEVSSTSARFWLSLRGNGGRAHEQPVVVLERFNLLGVVAETKRVPLEAVNFSRPWAEGWDGAELLLVEVPLRGLTAGNWRLSVHGTVGKEKHKWVTEPKKFTVRPAGPNRGRPKGLYDELKS